MIHRFSSWAMHVLSLFAACLVVGATVLTKLGRYTAGPDEGTAAHLFQLSIALLAPAGLVYLLTSNWRQPVRVAMGLVIPAIATIVAFATLYYMEHPH